MTRSKSEPAEAPAANGPLSGLRVIDMGMLFAGPLIATNLSDMGAEVIKIEHPKGDEVRKQGRLKDGQSLWWRQVARNKRFVAVDASRPEGAAVVRRLVRGADVFIENFRPGRMAKWGLDYKSLSADNPGLVMAHVSGYGQTGPYSKRPGVGTLAEAFSGFAFTTGMADGPPTLPQFPLADAVAAMAGTYSVLAALFARERNGGIGDEIDISLYEPLMSLLGPMLISYDQLGVVAKRRGNAGWTTPRNTYLTSDGHWIAVASAANTAALRLFKVMGREDMIADPRFSTNLARNENADECDRLVAEWIAQHPLDEILRLFEAGDVLAGPVNDVAQIFSDPHIQARGSLVAVDDKVLGKVRLQNVVPRFTRQPGRVRWLGGAAVGADTAFYLREAGFSDAEIADLESRKVIRTGGAA